jgi:hypothetical protein
MYISDEGFPPPLIYRSTAYMYVLTQEKRVTPMYVCSLREKRPLPCATLHGKGPYLHGKGVAVRGRTAKTARQRFRRQRQHCRRPFARQCPLPCAHWAAVRQTLCRARCLCRAACRIFAVVVTLPCALASLCRAQDRCRAPLLTLSCVSSLPCAAVILCRASSCCARQRCLCRVAAHGKDWLDGNGLFSRSG